MRMYPAYTLPATLRQPAVTFYSLLNEGYRLRYEAAVLAGQLNDLPSMSESDRNEFYQQLRWASMHPSDILNTEDEGSSPEQIKKLLG